eukprot:Colp12_sorted_trinity150504_noHs@13990
MERVLNMFGNPNANAQQQAGLEMTSLEGKTFMQQASIIGQDRLKNIRPWGEFADKTKFNMPKSGGELMHRMTTNTKRFLSNYLLIFLGLFVYCILTTPMLLIGLGVLGAGVFYVNTNNKVYTVAGKELQPAHQYVLVFLVSIPLFWLADAGTVVFWVLGASTTVIVLHAALVTTDDLGDWQTGPNRV